jgi:hypothetical protein
MLISYDDFPVHQTSEPLSYVATSDRNAYGRYWLNGFDRDGEYYFGIGLGIYPNREVMDCALAIVHRSGTQHNFRASRRLRGDRTELRVGPFSLEIVEPMRTLHVRVEENRTGLSADLVFHACSPAHEEPPTLVRQGVRVVNRTSRFTQFGKWEGHIDVQGRRSEITPERVYGVRDRSWGWRMLGEPDPGIARSLPGQVLFLWSPIHWADHCTHYGVFDADGVRTNQFGQVFPSFPVDGDFDPLSPEGVRQLVAGDHRLTFEPGSRFAGPSEYDLIDDGAVQTVTLEPLLRFHMMGLGYFHGSWGQGFYKGEEEMVLDHFETGAIDRRETRFQHVQTVVRATSGDRVGFGVLEQTILGPNERYGLGGWTDPLS